MLGRASDRRSQRTAMVSPLAFLVSGDEGRETMGKPAVRTFGPAGGVPSPPVTPPPTGDRRSSSTLRPTLPFDFSRARSTSGASSTASAWLSSFAEGIRGATSSARSDDGSSVIATSPPPVATHSMARKGSHSMTNPFNKAPPPPIHSVSSPQLPRKPPQPSNLSRLSSEADAEPRHRPSLSTSSANTSSASLPPIPRSSSAQFPSVSRTTSTVRPYKRGFQPAGVKNSRTDEFIEARKSRGMQREKEEGRLGKRWLKLVDLHFNPDPQVPLPASSSSLSLAETLTNVANPKRTLKQIDIKPRDVWKGFKDVAGVNPAADEVRKRAEEQAIVLWEADGAVKRCRVCHFSLANRKHHCRVCGRIVCSLPPSFAELQSSAGVVPGIRKEKCSLLLVADYKTGRGQEVDEGFVGWMKLEGDGAGEAPVKGVRVCRDCWSVVSRRKQIMDDRQRIMPFSRLYLALRSIQNDISEAMPLYEKEITAFKTADQVATPELLALHKDMLSLLAQYDVLSKRIATAPTPSASQETVQKSIARVATAFLQKAMAAVQDLPRIQLEQKRARVKMGSTVVESTLADLTDDTATVLQPLLEQEAQLETYIAEANARRKFEDAQSLTESLHEIRQEIARLVM